MCYKPIHVYTKDGQSRRVPCGKCLACLNKKANRLRLLCVEEAQHHRFTMFVTLTYSQEHVPRARFFYKEVNELISKESDKREFFVQLKNETVRLVDSFKETEGVLGSAYVTSSELEKILLTFKKHKYAHFKENEIPYAPIIDATNFIKRLRINIQRSELLNSKEEAKTIRYYCCSEYGPKTFRPHFHLLFFFDSHGLYLAFYNLVRKSWPYGNIDCELAKGGAANYCSAYTSANSLVSPLHQISQIRPRSTHSRHFGKGYDECVRKGRESLRFEYLNNRRLTVDGRVKQLPPSMSLQVALFPKCRGYELATCHERFVRYTALERVKRFCLPGTLMQYAQQAFDICLSASCVKSPFWLGPKRLRLLEPFEDCLTVESFYQTLCISSQFYRLCRDFEMSPSEYFECIEQYYKDKDSFELRTFYDEMTEVQDLDEQLSRYSNVPFKLSKHEWMCEHQFLYYAQVFGFENIEQFIKRYGEMCTAEHNLDLAKKKIIAQRIFFDRIKHKEVNEANGLFLANDDEITDLYNKFY